MEYLKMDDKYIYLNSSYAEIYIPKSYFENNAISEDFGSFIRGFGIFVIGFFENDKLLEYKVFSIPTTIDLYVTDTEEKTLTLPGDNAPTKYKISKYIRGEKITNSSVIMDSVNTEKLMTLILDGKLPGLIPYDKSIDILEKNEEYNGVSLGVPSMMEEMILASAYRYKENPSYKFAHIYGQNKDISPYDYVMMRVREICQYTSTFTGLTFEDKNSMITTSLNRTKSHGVEAYSPLEDIMKL